MTLEEKVDIAFFELNVSTEDQETIRAFLAPLKHKSSITYTQYEHCLRVGLLAMKIARFMHLDQKALLFAGLMHDTGKCQIDLATLGKTEGWTPKDTEIMKEHVIDGYKILKGRFDFSADIVLWHHRFQTNENPKRIPKPLHNYSRGTLLLIAEYGRILAVADVYDALHRVNDKFGEKKALNGIEIREKMFQFNRDVKVLVEELYTAGILSVDDAKTRAEKENEQRLELYDQSWTHQDINIRTPRETGRKIMLATALEPMSDKIGCTTRYSNISRHLKLEHFVMSGINIGEAFEKLAEEMDKSGKTGSILPVIYDTALRAQRQSLRNRTEGRINQGIIELLVPIVAAQHFYDPNIEIRVRSTLNNAVIIMQKTSKADINRLIEMKRFAFDLCSYADREVPRHENAKNIYEYYRADLASSTSSTSISHNAEFVNGFPTVLLAYNRLVESQALTFNEQAEEAYAACLKQHNREVGKGFIADCIAIAIYLYLSQNPKIKLIF